MIEKTFYRMYRDTQHLLEFEVTPDHLALLREMCVMWGGNESGAPAIDPALPYGSGAVIDDVASITMPHLDVGDQEVAAAYIEREADRLARLHAETALALQIALRTGRFEPGRYVRKSATSSTWERVATPAAEVDRLRGGAA